MRYELIDKEQVKRKLIQFDVQNGDELGVTQYLVMRDQQAQTELYAAINESLDEMGLTDVLVMGTWEQVPIGDEDKKDLDFVIQFLRRADENDIKYNQPLRQAEKRSYRR